MDGTEEGRERYADCGVTAEQAIRGLLLGRYLRIASGAAEPGPRVRVSVAHGDALPDSHDDGSLGVSVAIVGRAVGVALHFSAGPLSAPPPPP
ncbi:hypothetical protein JGU66_27580 [Myxococcaceae bacterium JPH2]|nr:hypothetical protein [Myxococcaceae bacterium JPH2]